MLASSWNVSVLLPRNKPGWQSVSELVGGKLRHAKQRRPVAQQQQQQQRRAARNGGWEGSQSDNERVVHFLQQALLVVDVLQLLHLEDFLLIHPLES
jgi:hypothetical protein